MSNINFHTSNNFHTRFGRKTPQGLASIDIDGTLIPWKKHEADYDKDIFHKNKQELSKNKNSYYYLLNSSRGYIQFKKIKSLLNDIPFNAISLNDGQDLFFRKTFLGLNYIVPSYQWRRYLKTFHNWDTKKAHKITKETLLNLSFKHLNSRESRKYTSDSNTQVYFLDKKSDVFNSYCKLQKSQNHFLLKTNNPEVFKALKSSLEKSFKEHNINITITHYFKKERYFIHLSPSGIDKSSPINFLIKTLPSISNIDHVVTVGDGINDLSMLTPGSYHNIKNFPIVIKNKSVADEAFNVSGHRPQVYDFINLTSVKQIKDITHNRKFKV